jgi:hypothetical protein
VCRSVCVLTRLCFSAEHPTDDGNSPPEAPSSVKPASAARNSQHQDSPRFDVLEPGIDFLISKAVCHSVSHVLLLLKTLKAILVWLVPCVEDHSFARGVLRLAVPSLDVHLGHIAEAAARCLTMRTSCCVIPIFSQQMAVIKSSRKQVTLLLGIVDRLLLHWISLPMLLNSHLLLCTDFTHRLHPTSSSRVVI